MPIPSSQSSNSVLTMDGTDASKMALLLVEKKVRNLEKRKQKLDGYKKQMDEGQELNDDQKKAIANLTSVEMSLEMTKDLQKQFQQMFFEHQKQLKKQARREQVASQAAQHSADVVKVGQVLELQSLMDNLSEDVRADFLNGTNGAVSVKEEEFAQIDDFYKLITPDSESDVEMPKQIKDSSEHIVNFLNGSSSEVAGTTYKALLEVVDRIKKCGYFDPNKPAAEAANEEEEEEEEEGSSGLSTPNGEMSGSGDDISAEQPVAPQEVAQEPTPPVPQPTEQAPPSAAPQTTEDMSSFTANEHGLNFLGDSEVEKPSGPEEAPPASDWAEEVENGQHVTEHEATTETSQPSSNGFVPRGRGGGRGGGYRGNFRGRGGGGDRGQRRGGRGGFGPPRGGFQDDGSRRGGNRGGRGGFSRGGGGGPRGGRRGGPGPQ